MMKFKVFCDGFLQNVSDNVESALLAYKTFSCQYSKDLTVLTDSDDPNSYGRILILPPKRYKDLTIEDIESAIRN